MKFTNSFFCSLFVLTAGLTLTGWAQTIDQLRAKEVLEAKLREEDEKNRKRVEKSIEATGNDARSQSVGINGKVYHSEKDLPALEKKILTPNSPEAQKYEAFLRQSDTGLIKLLNFTETKLNVHDVRSQSAYPQIPGGGTYYSFTKRNHLADEWAQIRLRNGTLQMAYTEMKRTTITESGGIQQSFNYTSGYSWALFTELGEVALNTLTLQTPALKAMAELQPPTQYQEFSRQQKAADSGLRVGEKTYSTTLPAKRNTTYALRSLNYKRADVMIVFQVIDQDSEGNLHILWKQLAHYPPPELKGKPQK